ncbi:MAG: helix-turn-helix domain-containing protein [Oscillospiraceae bacterium]
MFYEQLKKACKKNNTSVTAVLKNIGIGTANGTYWKNGSNPTADIVVKLSEFLGVSCDYLLTGKEPTPKATMIEVPKPQLTESEEDMLTAFRKLTAHQQCKLIVRAEDMAEENEKNNVQENVG